ncbi:MAG: DinB family protein [Hyphomicrobiales bacterium]
MDPLLPGLIDYNYWANRRLLAAAGPLSDEEWAAPPDETNIRSLLVHTLSAERLWRRRFQRIPDEQIPRLKPAEFPTLASLAELWAEDEREMRAWVSELKTDDLLATHPDPVDPMPLWQFLLQPIMHSAQHRAEVAMLLTERGLSPGNLDYLVYATEEAR